MTGKGSSYPFEDRRKHKLRRQIYRVLFVGLIDLDFPTLSKRILQLEAVAFVGVIMVVWASEIYDIPHLLFHAPARTANFYAAAMNTAWVLFVLVLMLAATKALLKKVRYLEGFLPVCSFCKSIRVEDKWVAIEQYLHERSDVKMTHSLCPPCAKKHYGYDENDPE